MDGRRDRRYKLSTTISRIVVDGPWIPGRAAVAAERPHLASRKADDLSRERGVMTVLPDIPINAGGVMVFRVEQSLQGFRWKEDLVNEELVEVDIRRYHLLRSFPSEINV